jgi:hypothetical protein
MAIVFFPSILAVALSTNGDGRLLPKHVNLHGDLSYESIRKYPELVPGYPDLARVLDPFHGSHEVITELKIQPEDFGFTDEFYWKPLHPNWPVDLLTTTEELVPPSVAELSASAWKSAIAFLAVAVLWVALIRYRQLGRGLALLRHGAWENKRRV